MCFYYGFCAPAKKPGLTLCGFHPGAGFRLTGMRDLWEKYDISRISETARLCGDRVWIAANFDAHFYNRGWIERPVARERWGRLRKCM